MNLKTVGKTIHLLLIAIVIISILSMILPNGSGVRVAATAVCTLMLVAAIGLWVVYARCPYCKRRIFAGLTNIEVCPYCRRNIETGKRKKGKSSRA